MNDQNKIQKRLAILSQHLLDNNQQEQERNDVSENSSQISSDFTLNNFINSNYNYKKKESSVSLNSEDTQILDSLLKSHDIPFRQQISDFLKEKGNDYLISLQGNTPQQLKEKAHDILVDVLKHKLISVNEIESNPMKFFAFMESLMIDAGASIKASVHFNLWGASVLLLGTERHHKEFLSNFEDEKRIGCFMMTELGHGSNVKELETTATYDPETEEFIINSPTESSQKYYIGNLGYSASLGVVFAQLIVGGERKGVHGFVVPIRDENGSLVPGLRIKDCGVKQGHNSVDNARAWFHHLRVPRHHLLNRYADIDPVDGSYTSSIANDNQRFATHIGALLVARIVVACGTQLMSKIGLTVAIRYSLQRRQFGPPSSSSSNNSNNNNETPLLYYPSHQRRLMPHIAATYAWCFFNNYAKHRYASRDTASVADMKQVHLLASVAKAMISWQTLDTLQSCREATGGQGYMTRNIIARLRSDADVCVTLDGDNTVLSQQIARVLLGGYSHRLKQVHRRRGTVGMASTLSREAVDDVLRSGLWASFSQTNRRHLRSFDFALKALQYRQQRMLRSLARRLNAKVNKGRMEPFAAWSSVQNHAIELARAYGEYEALKEIYHVYRSVDMHCQGKHPLQKPMINGGGRSSSSSLSSLSLGEKNKEQEEEQIDEHAYAVAYIPHQFHSRNTAMILKQLGVLYGLWCIERDPWFLSAKVVGTRKHKAIKREVDALCRDLVPNAEPLVDAFDIPDYFLAETVGSKERSFIDVNAYDFKQTE